jgi:uncharacterized protein (DUF1330 family)
MAAYVVNEITITDVDRYRQYAERMPDTLTPFGGRFLARGTPEPIAGEAPPGRVVILEFPDIEQAKRWRDSADYQALLRIRDASSTSRVYAIEGANLNNFVR